MALKDLGRTEKELYDSPATPASQKKNRIIYPSISFPLSFIEGTNLKVDDNVDIRVRGRVSGMQDTKWTKTIEFEAKQGEVKKSGKKGESIIKEA